jgi:hypothetical protein
MIIIKPSRKGPAMPHHTPKKMIAGALLSCAVAVTGLGLAAGPAKPNLARCCRKKLGPVARTTTQKGHVTGAQEILRCRPVIFV